MVLGLDSANERKDFVDKESEGVSDRLWPEPNAQNQSSRSVVEELVKAYGVPELNTLNIWFDDPGERCRKYWKGVG